MTTVRRVTSEAEARGTAAQLADTLAYEPFAAPPAPTDEEVAAEAEACESCRREEPRGAFCSSLRHRTHWARVRGARKAAALALVADAERDDRPRPPRPGPERDIGDRCILCGDQLDRPGGCVFLDFVPGLGPLRGELCGPCDGAMNASADNWPGYIADRLGLPVSAVAPTDVWSVRCVSWREAGRGDPPAPTGRWSWVDVAARLAAGALEAAPEPEPGPSARERPRRRLWKRRDG